MTPPEDPKHGNASRGDTPPAVSACLPPKLQTLTKRSDFLKASKARRQGTASMMVQARKRNGDAAIRVGFTCSKKVGNAVARNRAKRRLREIARQILPEIGKPGWDYVLIGRKDVTSSRPFEQMKADFQQAIHKLHADRHRS